QSTTPFRGRLSIARRKVIFITAMGVPDSHPASNEWRTHLSLPKLRQSMRFARAISQADGLAELQTYDCKECGVAVTEAADAQLTSTAAADRTPIIGALLSHGLLVIWNACSPHYRRALSDSKGERLWRMQVREAGRPRRWC